MASYLDYNLEPEDNNGAAPRGVPDGFRGPDIKVALRSLMAALRALGESTVKTEGLGSLGAQDAADVLITGGVIRDVRGFSFPGFVQPFWGTLPQADNLRGYGWLIADGRSYSVFTDATGTSRGPYQMPDLRGRFLRFFRNEDGVTPQQLPTYVAPSTLQTGDAGEHNHIGRTADTALGPLQVPLSANARTVESGGGSAITEVQTRASLGHGHDFTTSTAPAHRHSLPIPPYASLIPLLRMF